MFSSKLIVCSAVAGILAGASSSHGQEPVDSFVDALREGSVDLVFRYRYEFVDQSGFDSDANSSLLRTRVTYQSASFQDYSFLVEMDDLRALGPDDYNSTRNGRTDRPVVADPEATDLNQARVRYTGFADTTVTFGRQRINHTNQRFIGGVGWRQNEQTYDALEVDHTISDDFRLRYTYVDNVNRIFGPDSGSPAGDLRSSSHFIDASFDLNSSTAIGAYAYSLDFDNAASASSNTLGFRLTGMGTAGDSLSVPFTIEYARQGDNGSNPNSYDVDYYLLEAGLSWTNLTVKLSHEVLEGEGIPGHAFSTPLATLHPFQGWADKFLRTPDEGIEDTYVSVTGRAGGVAFTAIYHDYSAGIGGASFGDEINLQAGWSFAENYSVLLKLASYSADSHATDTDKIWMMLTGAF
ncbi:MAG: alginate export family protein [Gammaproteobacteria bacterium]